MQYKKKPHPPNSSKDIKDMHISTKRNGVKNPGGFTFYCISLSLCLDTMHLLQHTAIHIIIVIKIVAAESGNMKH